MEEMGMDGMWAGAVYVQTNAPHNEVIALERTADGMLRMAGRVATGGKGDDRPHLTSQGSVVLTGDGRHLLATNAGSDDVSLFRVGHGTPELLGTGAAGPAPKSVAEHAGLVYVLATGDASLRGFRVGGEALEPIEGSNRALPSPHADGAQVGFAPDGSVLVVTERGADAVAVYPVGADGLLGEPRVIASSGPTPYGFAFGADGTLVVTEAFRAKEGAAAASSYRLDGASIVPVSRSVGNGRSEICWAVISRDGRYAFTTNFADGAVSRYRIGPEGGLVLEDATAGIAVEGAPGLRDEDLTADGRYLYAIDADGGRVYGWAVGQGGRLDPIGSWGGVPTTVAGLAAS